jgi:hypothetical protein
MVARRQLAPMRRKMETAAMENQPFFCWIRMAIASPSVAVKRMICAMATPSRALKLRVMLVMLGLNVEGLIQGKKRRRREAHGYLY